MMSMTVFAYEDVEVVIPTFPVNLNGVEYSSEDAMYPLINYNGITYFPMTWNLGQSLGLGTSYTNENGLEIELGKSTGTLNYLKGDGKNTGGTYKAQLPSYKISVMNRTIDNSSEDYPILSFRDITYFPLTWKYAVEEFQWDYGYTNETGLVIGAKEKPTSTTVAKENILDLVENGVITLSESYAYDYLKENQYGMSEYFGYAFLGNEQKTIILHNKNEQLHGYYYDTDISFYDESNELILTYKVYGGIYISTDDTRKESGFGMYGAPNKYDNMTMTVKFYTPEKFEEMNDNIKNKVDIEYIKPSDVSKALFIKDGGTFVKGAYVNSGELTVPALAVYGAFHSQKRMLKSDGEFYVTGISETDHQVAVDTFNKIDDYKSFEIANERFGYDGLAGTNAQAILLLDSNKTLIKIYINEDAYGNSGY